MIRLSSIIKTFEFDFLTQYKNRILPSHRKALGAIKNCRSKFSPQMLLNCSQCDHKITAPHSCGHRHCPDCQHHESQQWLERQINKRVPSDYFLLTFTLPAEFRFLAFNQQRKLYSLLMRCSWETARTFAQNDPQLKGVPGAIAVLHTHTRRLDFHPHVHLLMPAAAINSAKRLWRTKTTIKGKKPFLFNQSALASVFRAKILDGIRKEGLALPERHPRKWVAHCKSVGSGEKALIYLGRYLYRGVIAQKDIISYDNKCVTFRFQNSKTKQLEYKTVSGAKFLWLVLQHVLPRRFRRTRDFGFLHHNSKRLITLLQWLLKINPVRHRAWLKKRPQRLCECCGAKMNVVKTQIIPMITPKRWLPR